MKQKQPKAGLVCLCGLFGYTRQAFYQQRTRNFHQAVKEEVIIEKVREKRKGMPRLGARKLLWLLKKDGIKLGRDKFFEILRHNGMLVKKRKHRIFTTQSKHWLTKYPNLIEGLEVLKPNKLWVADITYILVEPDFAYLFLITDAYSKKVLGHTLSRTLEATGGIEALKTALSQVDWKDRVGIIHHSDRGVQYCSYAYVELLTNSKMLISMTHGDPYENPVAERINGTFKTEWIYDERYTCYDNARERIAQIIDLYNAARPHMSCNMLTPDEAHKCTGRLKKHWKNYRRWNPVQTGI